MDTNKFPGLTEFVVRLLQQLRPEARGGVQLMNLPSI